MASQSDTIDWESEHRRFEEVAYSRAVREAERAFKGWHRSKIEDAVAECIAKLWSEWHGLVNRGRDPVPLLSGLIKYAVLFCRYDRRTAGRARSYDVYDYRSKMKQQQLSGNGQVSPSDRSDQGNGWIDWAVKARTDDPALLASALEELGLTMEDLASE